MQCRIANAFKFVEAKCDCEKASEQKENTASLPASALLHFHLDELYNAAVSQTTDAMLTVVLKKKMDHPEGICYGHSDTPYHPPRC